jgi:transposase
MYSSFTEQMLAAAAQVLAFFATLPPCVVAMEACGGAHFLGAGTGQAWP